MAAYHIFIRSVPKSFERTSKSLTFSPVPRKHLGKVSLGKSYRPKLGHLLQLT